MTAPQPAAGRQRDLALPRRGLHDPSRDAIGTSSVRVTIATHAPRPSHQVISIRSPRPAGNREGQWLCSHQERAAAVAANLTTGCAAAATSFATRPGRAVPGLVVRSEVSAQPIRGGPAWPTEPLRGPGAQWPRRWPSAPRRNDGQPEAMVPPPACGPRRRPGGRCSEHRTWRAPSCFPMPRLSPCAGRCPALHTAAKSRPRANA